MKKDRIKFTIRAKLLLLSIAVLSIPYVGFEYLRELERYFRDALEYSLTDAARAVAAPLHQKNESFPVYTQADEKTIYIHNLNHPVQIDGYTDDWLSYLGWADRYAFRNGKNHQSDMDLSFRLIVSQYDQYFNVLLQVEDDDMVLQQPGASDARENDHIILVFTDPGSNLKQYYFSPIAPGTIRPFQYRRQIDEFNIEYKSVEYATNITGEFQQNEEGYNLEIALPKGLVGNRLGFLVVDIDNGTEAGSISKLGTAGNATLSRPGRLVQSSPEIKKIITGLGKVEGRRVWVLDKQGQVLASGGSLERRLNVKPANFLYSLILPSVFEKFSDDLAGASRLRGQEVIHALAGRTETGWRSSPDGKAVIVSAATPVFADSNVIGAVVVEETTNNIQMLQRHAMASLFNKTLFVFAIVTLLLLVFATRLSFRLRRLSLEAEKAIDPHGRVVAEFIPSNAGDEIGELSRSYAAMLDRLKQYNQYLESLAGKLSHELRTPITVVQSSIEHIQSSIGDGDAKQYILRAREGIERLNLLVSRLSEATRLEQALQATEKHETDIKELFINCMEGYRLAYPQMKFELDMPDISLTQEVAPDLIVQMLDKLIANAVDFGEQDKPIRIALKTDDKCWQINVSNYGPCLPARMEGQLFNSMISIREKKDGKEPHLGLGLYVVRLIAEFHGGEVTAKSLVDQKKVTFRVEFRKNNGRAGTVG